jgi:butyryl-CoA dehydrogenase
VAIDFTLTAGQREMQAAARAFARDVLAGASQATFGLRTPEERFAATRPVYERMVQGGLLRQLVPSPLGGEGTGVLGLSLLAEELIAGDAGVALTLFATALGFTPVLVAGTPEQQRGFLAPFLVDDGAPLAAFAFSEPGGSANFASAEPGTGLRTTAKLDGDEWAAMRRHPRVSARLLRRFRFAGEEARAVEYHHERFDGRGYPEGASTEVPLEARILATADIYEALTADRPHRAALTPPEALRMMAGMVGQHLDPLVFAAFEDAVTGLDDPEDA